jgi:plastocyanin
MTIDQKEAPEMKIASTKTQLFSRQPQSALGKVTAGTLLVTGVLCGIIWGFSEGHPSGLLILTLALLFGAALVATGLCWTPLLGALIGADVLYTFASEPYVAYHLTQPKAGVFAFFVFILIILACSVVAIGTGVAATVQNYRQNTRQAPRWLAPALTGVAGMVIGALLLAAIAQPSVSASSTATNGEQSVHLGTSSFLQSSVTIAKGSKLMLVDDGSFLHILANGAWQNGQVEHAAEPGAPTINNVQVSSGSLEVGPFATAGTYHIYCAVHQGMNLTIIVR